MVREIKKKAEKEIKKGKMVDLYKSLPLICLNLEGFVLARPRKRKAGK